MATVLARWRILLLGLSLSAGFVAGGTNWKAVWLEKPGNPIWLHPGTVREFVVMGLTGRDVKADLTRSPYLEVTSLDPNVVEVDRVHAQLIGKSPGKTELRISFSEATSIVKAFVRPQTAQTPNATQ